jgi:hypothetical protein
MGAADYEPNARPVLLTRDVVRDVIAQVAHEELPLVDRLCRLDDERVVRLLTKRRRGRDLLGFGVDEVVALASPVVWVVVNEAAKRFANSAITGGAEATKGGLRKLFRRTKAASVVPPLTREQIGEVWRQTMDSALRNGMDEERARRIADCVAGRLVLGPQPGPARPPVGPERPVGRQAGVSEGDDAISD